MTNKGTFRSCLLFFVCCWLVSCLQNKWNGCLLIASVGCLAKTRKGCYSISSWFWVDSLITWARVQRTEKDDLQGTNYHQKAPQLFSKSLQVDSTWPSLVSIVLMRTFLVVVVSKWGLDSNIVSSTDKEEFMLSTCEYKEQYMIRCWKN